MKICNSKSDEQSKNLNQESSPSNPSTSSFDTESSSSIPLSNALKDGTESCALETLMTRSEVAKILRISNNGVSRLCEKGKLKWVQVDGKQIRFTTAQVNDFIEASTIGKDENQDGQKKPDKKGRSSGPVRRSPTATIEHLRKRMRSIK